MFANSSAGHRIQTSAILTVIFTMLSTTAFADALVRGRVNDASTERPLASAEVRLGESGRRVLTDSSGTYVLINVPAGNYSLVISYQGYETATQTIAVPADGTLEQNVGLTAYGIAEEVMVTGFRAAQLSSVQDKKSADIIKDSVDANDAGKLPDQNAAEALQRVPGVSITIDQGEGRYVAVRGIDPGLNNVTINGQSIGAPEADDRRVALDTIPSEVLSKLEVIKTITPDLDGNAIGGTVNLVTPSPYDDEDGFLLTGSADIGYYDLNGKSPYGFAGAWGQVFGAEDQFGALFSASFSSREYRSENVQTDIWEEEGDFFIPAEMALRDYTLQRERMGIVANLEWRPADDLKVYWDNLYNEFSDTEDRIETLYDYREGDLENQTPTSGLFTEGEGEKAFKKRLEEQSIAQSTLGVEFGLDHTTIDLSATLGRTKQDTPYDNVWSFEVADSLPMEYDTSDLFPRVTAPGEFEDPDFWEFNQHDRSSQDVEEDMTIFKADIRREMDFGANPGYLKGGLKYTGREKTSDLTGPIYDGYEDDLLLSQFAAPGLSNFYCSVRCGFYTFGPIVDYNAAEAFFNANSGSFEESFDDTSEAEYAEDFRVDEDVSAAYLMAGLDIGNWTLTGGVRMERTDSNYSAYAVTFDDGDFAEAVPTAGDSDYTDYLPGIVFRWQSHEQLVVRGGWTNTIGRPAYTQLVPYRIFQYEPNDDDELEGEVEQGNSDLDRLQSTNLDLSVEYYFGSGGILSAGLFHKDIENPIYNQSVTLEEVEFEGRDFAELEITTPQNGEDGKLTGLELNWQQQFIGLSAPWNGFGTSINYTWTDGEAHAFDRDDTLPFFLQPENIANVALFYERSGFEARLAWSYRDEYLEEVGGGPEEDLYLAAHDQLDFKTSYAITEQLDVFLEVLNITDEPVRFISGKDSGRLAENEIYSWNAVLGLQFSY